MSAGLHPALPAHAAALAALHATAFPAPDRWGETAFASQLSLPGVFALIATDAVQGACGLVLARVAADEAEILTLCVTPLARRRSHGENLVAAAMQAAAARGAGRLFLEVAEGNRAARGLYAKLGFAEVGRRLRYYPDGADALVLAAPLRTA